ncbi:hypothetical protein [Microbacterium sp. zg-YB36]|uniref:hypothetical protein n=1 Tax=Microbacterium sp. zg-YB36 TaxID=2969407 RepID=UPI00214D0F17|nr:hypothetical protein [Microbacterium sp. zg-YB36]MDL5351161.1 hypothetical protein [Microbacterium sp. zg-YB36]
MAYRVLAHPDVSPARIALAPRRQELADAYSDMGEGVVINDAGSIVAFHQRHLPILERRTARGLPLRVPTHGRV